MEAGRRRRTPREKKELEYIKDHVNQAEYPHRFRKSWPRKEAKTQRAFRRRVHQLSVALQARGENDYWEGAEPEAIRREPVRKWPVQSMGDRIQHRTANRLLRTAWNYFKKPYETAHDRERFAAFLASVTSGQSENSKLLAQQFHRAMANERPNISGRSYQDMEYLDYSWQFIWIQWHDWLQAFFKDEPKWEQRLREWIDSFAEA